MRRHVLTLGGHAGWSGAGRRREAAGGHWRCAAGSGPSRRSGATFTWQTAAARRRSAANAGERHSGGSETSDAHPEAGSQAQHADGLRARRRVGQRRGAIRGRRARRVQQQLAPWRRRLRQRCQHPQAAQERAGENARQSCCVYVSIVFVQPGPAFGPAPNTLARFDATKRTMHCLPSVFTFYACCFEHDT